MRRRSTHLEYYIAWQTLSEELSKCLKRCCCPDRAPGRWPVEWSVSCASCKELKCTNISVEDNRSQGPSSIARPSSTDAAKFVETRRWQQLGCHAFCRFPYWLFFQQFIFRWWIGDIQSKFRSVISLRLRRCVPETLESFQFIRLLNKVTDSKRHQVLFSSLCCRTKATSRIHESGIKPGSMTPFNLNLSRN